jgi:hypothetical protein
MATPLRQGTSKIVPLGSFFNKDGNPVVDLTMVNTDIKIWKSGASVEVDKNSGGATHLNSGRYIITLDETDTNTLGLMEVNVQITDLLPVKKEFFVYPAALFDILFMGEGLAEPTSPPPLNADFIQAFAYLYTAWRNPKRTSSLEHLIYNDDGTQVICRKEILDDGTNFDETKYVGP